jgi:hypothetical protein
MVGVRENEKLVESKEFYCVEESCEKSRWYNIDSHLIRIGTLLLELTHWNWPRFRALSLSLNFFLSSVEVVASLRNSLAYYCHHSTLSARV